MFNQAGALPPAALEDLVQQVKAFDVDAAIAAQSNGEQALMRTHAIACIRDRAEQFVLVDRPRPARGAGDAQSPRADELDGVRRHGSAEGCARRADLRQLRSGGRADRRGSGLLLGRRPQVRRLRAAHRRADPADVRAALDGGARRRHPGAAQDASAGHRRGERRGHRRGAVPGAGRRHPGRRRRRVLPGGGHQQRPDRQRARAELSAADGRSARRGRSS